MTVLNESIGNSSHIYRGAAKTPDRVPFSGEIRHDCFASFFDQKATDCCAFNVTRAGPQRGTQELLARTVLLIADAGQPQDLIARECLHR
jgi:hypothetical protein